MTTRLINDYTIKVTYDMLRKMPPFNAWALPPPHKIIFESNNDPTICGEFDVEPMIMRISTHHQETYVNMMRTVAHEMVHLKLYLDGKTHYDRHDNTFRKLMYQFNALYGFDRKEL